MKHLHLFAAPCTLLFLAGCGEKPPPIVEAKAIEKPQAEDPELKAPPRPDASDAAAKKWLDQVLAAHTGGQPDRLAALRECTFTRKGLQDSANGRFPTTWTRQFAWPGRYRLRIDLDLGGGTTQQLTFATGPAGAWRANGRSTEKDQVGPEEKANLTGQMYEDALTLLFLFADPAAVVGVADASDPAGPDLNVWVPVVGYARLSFDPKTKLLTRLTYNGREMGQSLMKEVTFGDYKEYGGVKLAAKLTVRTKTKSLGEWTELSVDTTRPDARVFDGP